MALHDIEQNILRLSLELESHANEMDAVSQEMQILKEPLEIWKFDQDEKVRNDEREGKLKMKGGHEIKLTDAIRDSLVKFGRKKDFARYEALKRRSDTLEQAIRAKTAALSGHQTLGKIEVAQISVLKYQEG